MNADAKLQTGRSLTGRLLRWVRYVCLTALALLVGYVSRDWTRSPIWRKELPLYTMIAGVSEARNEIVLVTQYDHASKVFSGTPIRKRKKNDSAKRTFIAYESVPVAELEFSSPRNGPAVIPSTITIETRELSSGQVIKSLTINADNIYSVAGVDERTVTLAHVLGGILQVDRSNGATVTNQSFLGHCLLSPTGEYWANHQNIFATRSGEAIYQFSEGIQSGYGIGGLTWSPDGNKLAFSISTEPDPFNPGSKGHWDLKVFDVTTRKAASIQYQRDPPNPTTFMPRISWLNNQHLFLVETVISKTMATATPEQKMIGEYQYTGSDLVKVPLSRLEVDLGSLLVTQRQLSDDTWLLRSSPTPSEREQQLAKLVEQSQIPWLIELWLEIQNSPSIRFERRKSPSDSQPLASVFFHKTSEINLSEANRYLIASTVIRPSDKELDRAIALARTKQFVAVYNFTPAVLPTWLFQLSVAAIAFVVLFAVSTLFSWLVSIVSRRVFRSKAPQ